MAGPAALLRDIHRLRIHARDLQDRVDNAPRQLKAQQKAVANQEDALRLAQDDIKKLKVAVHDKEVSVKSALTSIKKYEQQINDISNKKEYDALKAEIATARARIVQLEDEALTEMTEVDERTAKLPAFEDAVKKAKAEFAAFERDYQSRLADWTRQRDETVKKIADIENELPKDMRQMYDRLVKSMGADALSPVVNSICTACHTALTAQVANNVKLQQIVFCRSCARILYIKEEG